jgi:ABC-type transport system involved in cytochrome bd biosynthesis fused ATPase/permease subunit
MRNPASMLAELGEHRTRYLVGASLKAFSTTLAAGQAYALATLLAPFLTRKEPLWIWLVPLGAIALCRLALTHFGDTLLHDAVFATKIRLRSDLARDTIGMSLATETHQSTLNLKATHSLTVDNIEPFFTQVFPALAGVLSNIFILGGFTWVIDPISGAILVAVLLATPLVMALIGISARRQAEAQWKGLRRLGNGLLDSIRGVATIRALGREETFTDHLDATHQAFHRRALEAMQTAFFSNLALDLGTSLGIALVAVSASLRLLNGTMAFQDAILVLLLLPELFGSIRAMGALFHAENTAHAAFTALNEARSNRETLSISPLLAKVFDERQPDKPRRDTIAGTILDWQTLQLNSIGFLYPNRSAKRAGVHNISIVLRRGEKLALIGENGAGKSTLLQLLAGVIPPASGTFSVDACIQTSETWQQFATESVWIPQNAPLLSTTIAENLSLGSEQVTDEAMRAMATRTGAHPFIERLPYGYQTLCRPEHWMPSTGEAQRILLTRAMLQETPLLLLDEASAHLSPTDLETLHQTLANLPPSTTLCIASHRRSTCLLCNRVILLKNGTIAEVASDRPSIERLLERHFSALEGRRDL